MTRGFSIVVLGALALALALPGVARGQVTDAAADAAAEATAPEEAATTPAPTDGWDAVVLSYGGDSPEDVAATARDAAALTLDAEGYRVLPEADVTARIPPSRLRDASSISALRAIGEELGARAVVTVAVWMSDAAPGSVAVSIATDGRSFSGTAEVETDLGVAAAAAVRAALERQRRALLLDAGTGGSTATSTVATDDEEEAAAHASAGTGAAGGDPWSEDGTAAPPPQDDGPSELFGILGPGLLLAIGGAGLGLGIYGVLDGTCSLRAPMSGDCLRGEDPNIALGTLFIIGGALSLAGAIIWWITDANLDDEPRIDVADLDLIVLDGGALGVARGTF